MDDRSNPDLEARLDEAWTALDEDRLDEVRQRFSSSRNYQSEFVAYQTAGSRQRWRRFACSGIAAA